MIGCKFYKRTLTPSFGPTGYLQDGVCLICSGRWTVLYYPTCGEWFDIYNKAPTGPEAFLGPGLKVESISFRKYVSITGAVGFKRAVNCFFGRHMFSVKETNIIVPAKEEPEYDNTDDFFDDAPEGFRDLKPPVIFGGIITGDEDG